MHYSNNELLAIVGLPAADPLVRQVLADWHIFPNKQTVEGLTFTVDQCGGDGWQGCHKPCAMLLHVGANKVQSLRLWTNAPQRMADLCLPYALNRADSRNVIVEGLRANRYLILEPTVPNTVLAYTLFDDRLIYFYVPVSQTTRHPRPPLDQTKQPFSSPTQPKQPFLHRFHPLHRCLKPP